MSTQWFLSKNWSKSVLLITTYFANSPDKHTDVHRPDHNHSNHLYAFLEVTECLGFVVLCILMCFDCFCLHVLAIVGSVILIWLFTDILLFCVSVILLIEFDFKITLSSFFEHSDSVCSCTPHGGFCLSLKTNHLFLLFSASESWLFSCVRSHVSRLTAHRKFSSLRTTHQSSCRDLLWLGDLPAWDILTEWTHLPVLFIRLWVSHGSVALQASEAANSCCFTCAEAEHTVFYSLTRKFIELWTHCLNRKVASVSAHPSPPPGLRKKQATERMLLTFPMNVQPRQRVTRW